MEESSSEQNEVGANEFSLDEMHTDNVANRKMS